MAELRGRIGALVLDADGLVKLADGNSRAVSLAKDAYEANAPVIIAASTLTEVLRGGPRDAPVHRVIHRIEIASIDESLARRAGELLGRVGVSGHTHALDALVAVVAMDQPRPAVILTSDTEDMKLLVEEPQRARRERVAVVRV